MPTAFGFICFETALGTCGKAWGEAPRADGEIRNLAELPTLLASWRHPAA